MRYDREADALYIQLLEGQFQCRPVRVTDDISLDFTTGEKLVGIEVLAPVILFRNPEAPAIELSYLLPRITA